MKNLVIFLLLFCLGTAQAEAEPVTWYLLDVNFADDGTAFGSFDYDADANVYSNVAITSTSGSAFSGADYGYGMLLAEFTPSATSVNLSPAAEPRAKGGELMLAFSKPLTNAGGTIAIATQGSLSKEGLCVEAPLKPEQQLSCDGGGLVDWLRTVIGGAITTSAPDTEV